MTRGAADADVGDSAGGLHRRPGGMLAAWIVYLRTRPTPPALTDRPPNFDRLQEMERREETTDIDPPKS